MSSMVSHGTNKNNFEMARKQRNMTHIQVVYFVETVTGYDVMSNAFRWACLLSVYHSWQCDLLYTDALVYSTECLKYEQSGILNEII